MWFGSIFKTPFFRSTGQTDIKTFQDRRTLLLFYMDRYFLLYWKKVSSNNLFHSSELNFSCYNFDPVDTGWIYFVDNKTITPFEIHKITIILNQKPGTVEHGTTIDWHLEHTVFHKPLIPGVSRPNTLITEIRESNKEQSGRAVWRRRRRELDRSDGIWVQTMGGGSW